MTPSINFERHSPDLIPGTLEFVRRFFLTNIFEIYGDEDQGACVIMCTPDDNFIVLVRTSLVDVPGFEESDIPFFYSRQLCSDPEFEGVFDCYLSKTAEDCAAKFLDEMCTLLFDYLAQH